MNIVALVRVSTDKQEVNNQKFAIEKNTTMHQSPGSRSQVFLVLRSFRTDQFYKMQLEQLRS